MTLPDGTRIAIGEMTADRAKAYGRMLQEQGFVEHAAVEADEKEPKK